jgi:hypothetical protein
MTRNNFSIKLKGSLRLLRLEFQNYFYGTNSMSYYDNQKSYSKRLSLQNILKELSIGFEDQIERDLKSDSLDKVIESISLRYYCFTILNLEVKSLRFSVFFY